jgi:alpha-1,2-mannosyltransferase
MKRLRWLPTAILGTTFMVYWVRIVLKAQGDFPNHWELGRRMLFGEFIYDGGLDFVYPPFWALAHAPLALIDVHVAQIMAYALAPLALAGLLWTLHQLTQELLPLDSNRLLWSTTVALALGFHFFTRDLPEIGINTALVTLSWLAIYLWTKNRVGAAGISLGLAAALKCTPLLFVAYFALKREWKMVAVSSSAFVLFSLSPMIVQGPDQYVRTMRTWLQNVAAGIADPDPSRGPLGEEKVENLSLRPALARYLMHLPYGHLGRPETSDSPDRPNRLPNPFYVQFIDLSPYWAGVAVRAIMIGMLFAIVWSFRKRPSNLTDTSVLFECATISLLILLYSPITWKQHCVGVIPALYLICRMRFAGYRLPGWTFAALTVYALFALILSRELIGQDAVKLLDSYHAKTAAILLLTGTVLSCRHLLTAPHASGTETRTT